MKEFFEPGVLAYYAVPNSEVVRIVSYHGEGFYQVITITEGTLQLAHEDDLILDELYDPSLCREELKYRGCAGKPKCWRCRPKLEVDVPITELDHVNKNLNSFPSEELVDKLAETTEKLCETAERSPKKKSYEDEFWEMVGYINWGSASKGPFKTDDIKTAVLNRYGEDKCHDMWLWHKRKYRALMEVVKAFDKDNIANVGDDGFWDLCAHVVGLGKDAYEYALLNPAAVALRGRDRKYKENFGYCIPHREER